MKNIEIIKKFDEKYMQLIEQAKQATNDESFSKSDKIKSLAFELVELLKQNNEQVTCKNLTNMNHHILVKVLNYNGFFKKQIPVKLQNELKTLKIY